MWSVVVSIEDNEVFKPTEIIADLQVVAETLFHPLRTVGLWDFHADDMHICPQERKGDKCPHKLSPDSPDYISYSDTAQRDLGARLRVQFPHANVSLYLR